MYFETPYKGPRGIYHVKVYDPATGKRTTRSTRARSARDAMKKIVEWRDAPEVNWTTRKAWDTWTEGLRKLGRSPEYLRTIEYRRGHIIGAVENVPIADVDSPQMLAAFGRIAETMAPSTHNTVRLVARSFFNWCRRSGLTRRFPTRAVAKARVPIEEPRVLEIEERQMILEAAGGPKRQVWLWPWIQVLLGSGLRIGTSAKLQRRHFTLGQKPMWDIPSSIMKNRVRVYAPMTRRAATVLRWWTDIMDISDPDDNVFPTSEERIRTHFNKCVRAAGLPDVTPHALRRTFITEMIRAGADMKVVMRLIGSQSEAVVFRHYREVRARDMEPVVETYDLFALPIEEVTPTIGDVPATNDYEWNRIARSKRLVAILALEKRHNEAKKALKAAGREKGRNKFTDVNKARYFAPPKIAEVHEAKRPDARGGSAARDIAVLGPRRIEVAPKAGEAKAAQGG